MSVESDQIAAAAAEITAATAAITSIRGTPQDALATERSVGEEAFIRARDIAWIRRFIGQTANDIPGYTAHTGIAGVAPADGDTLELAIAKLAALFTLTTRHAFPAGTVIPLATSKTLSQVHELDLLDTAQAANNVAANNGPFWLLCDGTTQKTQATPDFRGRLPFGNSDGLSAAERAALGIPSVAVAGTAGKAATYQRLADMPRHQHTIDHGHANGTLAAALNTQGDDVGAGTQVYGISSANPLIVIPDFNGNSGVTPTNGTYNDTTKLLTIDDTTGLAAGDLISVTHASIGGTQELQIATVASGTTISFVTNPFDGGGNQTAVTYRSWTPSLNPVRGVLWIMRSNRVSYY